MAEDALTVVALRNKFYKDSQRKIILALLVALVVNIILAALLVYMITHPPAPKYFATSINGRITPLFPLNEPNQSDPAVLQWANQAAIAAFSYNFVNYRDELQAASGFFTPEGWDQFLNALQQSNNLDAVKAKKLIVSAVATRAPIILQKGVLNGNFSWRVQMPILVTYQSASEFTQQNNVVTMLITRISTLNSPRGIGISQFVVGPATGGVS
ncbi:type IVB secretion system apparatus protein IcmL/DotI [Fluoribacter dumoffii]|uniref:Macrophage killing protein with similarity to conjugation protein n=1 Tax=Fluoribacter dumoffii TaxID=463 RepID=A0A377GD05_9GAMM|nr:type IVB secretion system apparatus protein IcmL/DotI [Fluoribacter dumoffii]KTC91031.1 protein IcmL (DotI) [Fluoribacter dumoffii NY 23]MCW8386600.1 type IVB secretion system apparatus protein IcmL/DotI [Fluoribacter dumoffii]MCW8419654.1 type IVB secretion system apparatus protein IcmL/DotI [Fluoribacter dumoffii]MCW8455643.1 type IVB secretion system apparatus protein IcmL/DotI [Fluoribacter dumoffii]MCW8460278.1 type IVB secretion system apparatus protein IcmL/DotI [Fluoribacter dumoffi